MYFFDTTQPIRLLTVLDFEANPKQTPVAPRNFHSLSFRLSGVADFTDEKHRVSAKAGDILYMPAGAPYHLCRHENERVIAIHFETESNQDMTFDVFSPTITDGFKQSFLSLTEIWNSKRTGYYCRAMAVFYDLLYQIQHHLSAKSTNHYSSIRPAIHHIHTHYCDTELSIPSLARLCAISETYFRKMFEQSFDMTPLQYINSLRIDHAVDLLTTNEMSIEEIAQRCGFNDAKYFSTVFKKYKGISPRRFSMLSKKV